MLSRNGDIKLRYERSYSANEPDSQPSGRRRVRSYSHRCWRKLTLTMLYSFTVYVVAAFTMTVAHSRVPDMSVYRPLPDIALDNIPHIPWAFKVTEVGVELAEWTLIFLRWPRLPMNGAPSMLWELLEVFWCFFFHIDQSTRRKDDTLRKIRNISISNDITTLCLGSEYCKGKKNIRNFISKVSHNQKKKVLYQIFCCGLHKPFSPFCFFFFSWLSRKYENKFNTYFLICEYFFSCSRYCIAGSFRQDFFFRRFRQRNFFD